MKRQYIIPCMFVVKLEMRSILMQMSVSEREISGEDAGLSREDNSDDNGNNRSNIWDNAW